jgi:hypothetical protein
MDSSPSSQSSIDVNPRDLTPDNVAEMLAEYSCRILQCFNTRNVEDDFLLSHLSPTFQSAIEDFPKAFSAAEHIENIRHQSLIYPFWTLEVINKTATLYDKNRRAKVWLTLDVHGIPLEGRQMSARESVAIVRWRRVPGKQWVCTKWIGTRGPGTSKHC